MAFSFRASCNSVIDKHGIPTVFRSLLISRSIFTQDSGRSMSTFGQRFLFLAIVTSSFRNCTIPSSVMLLTGLTTISRSLSKFSLISWNANTKENSVIRRRSKKAVKLAFCLITDFLVLYCNFEQPKNYAKISPYQGAISFYVLLLLTLQYK